MSYAMINLQDYATFSTIDEMDDNVKHFNRQLNKAHYETLNLLKQHSLKVIGVSHLKIQTIADRLNKSVSTIKRHVKYLKDNGYITVVNTSRTKKGGKGANAYIINTNEYRKKYLKNKNELSEMNHRKGNKNNGQIQSVKAFAYVKARKETIESLKLFNNNKSTKNVTHSVNVDNARSCPPYVPYSLYLACRPFLTDHEIENIYNAALRKIKFFKSDITNEYRDQIIEMSFKSLLKAIREHKVGRRHDEIKNKRNYILSAVWHSAMKLETGNDLEDYITPIKHNGVESLFV